MTGNPFRKLSILLETIKFEHTLFALPFALISMLVAADTNMPGVAKFAIPPLTVVWVLAAMVGARSSAMMFNRIADRDIDARNPRTATRAMPRGTVSVGAAWVFTIASASLLVVSAYMLNPLAFALSPVALGVILLYSYSKRFTSLSHLWLGLALGVAPVGAWIAVTGRIGFPALILSASVMLWTAGFDIIYSLQDIEFDRKFGLYSVPAKLGPAGALLVSRVLHVLMLCLLVWFGIASARGNVYYMGVVQVAALLAYEHWLVKPEDLSRVNAAFFNVNGFLSVALLGLVVLDLILC